MNNEPAFSRNVTWLQASLITGMSISHIALLVKKKCVRGHKTTRRVNLSMLSTWQENLRG